MRAMSDASLPLVQPYHPTTFLERGVAVPFTTPLLGGTRARPADRSGTELIIPNPSGSRGVYILPWHGVRQLCAPTVHDAILQEKISALPAVTPAAIRRAAHEVAAEGFAGEDARQSAQATAHNDTSDRLVLNFQLLVMLIQQVDPSGPAPAEHPEELEDRARRTVARIAPGLGRSPNVVADSLESLADLLQALGTQGQARQARIPRLLRLLSDVRNEMDEWGQSHDNDQWAAYAQMICTNADLTLSLAAKSLDAVHAMTGDMVGLLRNWTRSPDTVAHLATRPEWLLDGWEPICLIWHEAADLAGQRRALAEMAQLVPVLPRETSEWSGVPEDLIRRTSLRKLVRLNRDWRTEAAVFALIARNERLRSLAA
jgi:hypothetical protein